VALSDGWLAVGEPDAKLDGVEHAGAVSVYRWRKGRWDETQRLALDGAAEELRFGGTLAMDAGVLAVRAAGDRCFGAAGPVGSVLVFELEEGTWTRRAKLCRDMAGRAFGEALAVDEGRVLVGVPSESEFQGGAFLFERGDGGWKTCRVLGPQPRFEGDFGRTVAFDGSWAAIGSWGGVPDNAPHGVVLFHDDGEGWHEVQRLEAQGDGGPLRDVHEPWFGSGLAIEGRELIVGARYSQDNPHRRGAAFHFHLDESGERWSPVGRLEIPETGEFQDIGAWVALESGRLWVGAPGSNLRLGASSCRSGAVLTYELAP